MGRSSKTTLDVNRLNFQVYRYERDQVRLKFRKSMVVTLLLVLLACVRVANGEAQGLRGQPYESDKESFNYGFVSPNTRNDLRLEEAIKKLNSVEELRLMNETRLIGCRVASKVRIMKAVGS